MAWHDAILRAATSFIAVGTGAANGYEAAMKHEPGIFDDRDPAAEAAAIARARADIAAGRSVPHEKVAAWLKTWGTPDERPMPPEWLE